jgi:hypothetical protein
MHAARTADRSAADQFGPIPFRDPNAGAGGTGARPTWWLDDAEHARLLGIKPASRRKAIPPRRPPPAVKPADAAPARPPETAEAWAVGDFNTLAPTLQALDRLLGTPEPGAPLPAPPRHWSKRFGVAFGLAAVMAIAVFFR